MDRLQIELWDSVIILSYIIILLFIGYRAYRRSGSQDTGDFLLNNRSLSLPAFVATLVTTWYGGILGIGEYTYSYGISTWVVFGLPYYFFAALFAVLIAGKIRAAGQYTIADIFYMRHSRAVGILGSIFLLFMASPAPYILMVALLLQVIFGWSFILCLVIGTAFSTIYVFWGGFRSVVQTDKFQFLAIYTGFAVILLFLIYKYGGMDFLTTNVPAGHFTWHGGNSPQYIAVWFFLASWTFIDPGFHQRCAAAKTLTIARKGILVSVGFWLIFDFLTISTGLYASALLRDINPVLSFPLLADRVLPPVLKGIFLTGLLAVIMSTIDSFSLISAMTFGRDLIWRIKGTSEQYINRYTRFGLLLTGILSILLCILFPSVVRLWYVIGSLFIPPMLIPVLTAYFPRFAIPGSRTLAVMITGFTVSAFSFLWGTFQGADGAPAYPFGLEPFFPGLLAALLVYMIFLLAGRTGRQVTKD